MGPAISPNGGSVRERRALEDRFEDRLTVNPELILAQNSGATEFQLPNGYSMRYGSEPDILFQQDVSGGRREAATIEIKGGKDPADPAGHLSGWERCRRALRPLLPTPLTS